MSMKNEIKAHLIASLESILDPYMARHNFVRRSKSLAYKRKYKVSLQTIDIVVQIHPTDNRNAAAAVYPLMEVFLPSIDRLLRDIVGENPSFLLSDPKKGLLRQPIDFTSQKAELGRWYLYQPDSVPEIVRNIKLFIETWTMPFLDVYGTPEDIVDADERKDGRIIGDRPQKLRVIAAALLCNRKAYAQAVMEKQLGRPGVRAQYRQFFEYIENLQ